MRNKYPGNCYYCNKIVEKGHGHFEKCKYGWRTIHAECVLERRKEKQAKEDFFDDDRGDRAWCLPEDMGAQG